MTGYGHACGMSEGKCLGHSYKCGPAVGHVLCVRSQHLGGANAVEADEPTGSLGTEGGQRCSLEHHHSGKA